jgi:uncharacterized protein (DUF1330 family)
MQVTNEVLPTDPKQIEAMMQPGPAGPIFMVNLLKFKDKAEYADGRETSLSGRDAYNIYGKAIMKILPEFGGKPVFMADTTFLALGQVEELWDEVAIVMYPDRGSLLRMSMSQAWQEISVHRTAGLKGQLNIETVMPPAVLAMFAKG